MTITTDTGLVPGMPHEIAHMKPRDDEGELSAWECTVTEHTWGREPRRARVDGKERTP